MTERKFSILFGAGASKDAGLPDAFELTEAVYLELKNQRSEQSRLFAIIVAKLILRNSRKGNSPFDRVNIEEVYDSLKRLVNRDDDPLAEFVSGWDSSLATISGNVNPEQLIRAVLSPVSVTNSRRFDRAPSIEIDTYKLSRAAKYLDTAISGGESDIRGASLEPFITTLTNLLDEENAPTTYLESFLNNYADKAVCLATLNYDRLVEKTLKKIGLKYDLGLNNWNDSRFVKFHGRSLKLIKLHGSTDWKIKNEDEIEILENANTRVGKSGMIFGGQSDKLVPHGPYLHLRHEFYRFMRQSSYLIVVGYSYGDVHLNALIRSWIATRRNGKLINVDPGGFRGGYDLSKVAFVADSKGRQSGKRIEVQEIRKGFAAALEDIEEALRAPPNTH